MTMRSAKLRDDPDNLVPPSMRAWPNDHAEDFAHGVLLGLWDPSMRAWPNDHAEPIRAACCALWARSFNEGMAE